MAVDVGFGEKKRTQWIECSVWGKRAESLAQYITKGELISVSGEISVREWESGTKHGASLECNCREVTLCGGGGQQANQNQKPAQSRPAPSQGQAAQPPGGFDDLGDDIPFN